MDSSTRNHIQRATQAARGLLEDAFREQLEGTYDILLDGTIAKQAGSHLPGRQKVTREKLVAAVAHKRSTGFKDKESVDAYLREAAFTTLNRFVALKMLEARDLVQQCVSSSKDGLPSGFKELTALAPGLVSLEDKGYRLYIETLFDEIGQEVKVLFDRRDVASLLWPDRQTLLELLGILNAPELASVWAEDETIGWVYQYFNGDEERTKMRAESQAPRNSRELAVRNQFFTPRYVVQFLTDNTLGRTWYEMMQGETKLAHLDYRVRRPNEVFLAEGESAPESDTDDSELSQEELLQQTVHVPFRAKKDPRDLRILDPACGSGHFLLYTFDLLITIYEEAWTDAEAAAFTQTGAQLRTDYGSLKNLRRAIPELILRHNLHGVDIDPRATQIAALALWMRAQRAYNQFDVDRAQRPPITNTNIVVAEPMPGDAELVEEFAASLKPAVLGDLFKKMVEEMKLAGEAGSLLRVEKSIARVVRDAAETNQQGDMFTGKVESHDFWDAADEKIIAALGHFAESAAGAGGVRLQLFAGDATQGVAFIELMRRRYDAIVMNPPFGPASKRLQKALKKDGYQARDLAADFFIRAIELSERGAAVGAITTRTIFFLKGFLGWRSALCRHAGGPRCFLDIGFGVLDAAVEAAAFTFNIDKVPTPGHYFRALGQNNELEAAGPKAVFQVPQFIVAATRFENIPRQPFAYWAPPALLRAFSNFPNIGDRFDVLSGGNPRDDTRFVRHWVEVPLSSASNFVPYSKGGEFALYYYDVHLMLKWKDNARELKVQAADYREKLGWSPDWRALMMNYDRYFTPAITWPRRTSRLSFRFLPSGCVFGDKSPVVTTRNQPLAQLVGLISYMNTAAFDEVVKLMVGSSELAQSFEVGIVKSCPLPGPESFNAPEVKEMFADLYRLDSINETSHAFVGFWSPASVRTSLRETFSEVSIHRNRLSERILRHQSLVEKSATTVLQSQPAAQLLGSNDFEVFSENEWGKRCLSYFLGVIFGRWDVRNAPGELSCSQTLEPFDALPSRSPGMLRAEFDLPISKKSSLHGDSSELQEYPVDVAWDGLVADDAGNEQDLLGRIARVFEYLWTNTASDRISEAAELVGARNQDLRLWFAKDFFAYHIKQYSKSGRKAPIYWQLATPSASYSVWCYYHLLTRDTFFRVANDYVTPKVDHEERKLNSLQQEAGSDPSSKQRKAIDTQQTFVAELRTFLTEVKRIAPLWNPNLNDGVIINFAPLWRLVTQHKPWQKECKNVWDKLCEGDYDWAHLAMHLWPERVVSKCQDDRSLAIAHGLEAEFWYEGDDEKWEKLHVSNDRVEELIAQRTSAAMKAALADLLEAPSPTGQTRRKRKAGA